MVYPYRRSVGSFRRRRRYVERGRTWLPNFAFLRTQQFANYAYARHRRYLHARHLMLAGNPRVGRFAHAA